MGNARLTLELQLKIVVLAVVLGLWTFALWIFVYRNRAPELSQRLPVLRRYRDPKFRPLFRRRSDVLWFAFWPFAFGVVMLVLLLLG